MPKQPDFSVSFRPLVWHMKAVAPGVANAHCIIFSSVEVIGHDEDIMNDLVFNLGKFAGSIKKDQLVTQPVRISELRNFIVANFPTE